MNDGEKKKDAFSSVGEDEGGVVQCLVRHLDYINEAFMLIGRSICILAVFLSIIPLFFLAAKDWRETIGEWHLRVFGKTLHDRFLPNVETSNPTEGAVDGEI